MYLQTRRCLEIIEAALLEAGSGLRDVIRTRVYTTDISRWEAIARAHAEFFGEVRPASTMVEVRRLISPEFLVEIDADAISQ
jgi:enamine deaminase RidA (YjgF/YER057c/UK114 family)